MKKIRNARVKGVFANSNVPHLTQVAQTIGVEFRETRGQDPPC